MFKGSMPALVTPFKNGAVDFDTLKQLVDWHVVQGSHGLVPVGTTGESPTLTHEEHEEVVTFVVKAAAGRIPLWTIVLDPCVHTALEKLHGVEQLGFEGAEALFEVVGKDEFSLRQVEQMLRPPEPPPADDAPPTPAVSDEVEEEAARAEQTHDDGSQD